MPLVSILIPVYNGEQYLRQALWSVADQVFTDYELIAINDGSTDKSQRILEAWQKPITIINHDKNLGVGKALNDGLERAQGTFISYLSSDDLFLPCKLGIEVAAFNEHPEADIVYSDFIQLFPHEERLIKCPEFDAERLWHECPLNIGSTLIRKKVLDAVKFSEDLRYCVDGDLWQRLRGCNFHHIPTALSKYRIHKKQSSNDLKAQLEAIKVYGVSLVRLKAVLRFARDKFL